MFGNIFRNMPTVTKNLLIINVLVWLAQVTLPKVGIDLTHLLGLHFWLASDFNPAQLITYMFLHSDDAFTHLFFNMFSLMMFGPLLERTLGSKRFLFYYLTCGLGAAFVQEFVWQFTWKDIFTPFFANSAGITMEESRQAIEMAIAQGTNIPALNALLTVGASGAIFGILLAFGMLFPNLPLYLMFIPIPIKAKYMVFGYGAIEFFFGISGTMSSVAHFAHLGGMLFGFLLLFFWKKKGNIGGNIYQ